MPLIGIGGIDCGAAAIAKLEAGATLLQLYTGLIYEGPGLLARIKQELVACLERGKLASIAALDRAPRAEAWAAKAPRVSRELTARRASRLASRTMNQIGTTTMAPSRK